MKQSGEHRVSPSYTRLLSTGDVETLLRTPPCASRGTLLLLTHLFAVRLVLAADLFHSLLPGMVSFGLIHSTISWHGLGCHKQDLFLTIIPPPSL